MLKVVFQILLADPAVIQPAILAGVVAAATGVRERGLSSIQGSENIALFGDTGLVRSVIGWQFLTVDGFQIFFDSEIECGLGIQTQLRLVGR